MKNTVHLIFNCSFCIGTSGLIGYYEIFMKSLYDTLQHDYVVWGLGHGGHDFHAFPDVTLPSIRGNLIFLFFILLLLTGLYHYLACVLFSYRLSRDFHY